MTVLWTICRDDGKNPLERALAGRTDLGTFQHVRKILESSFRGLTWRGNIGHWADKHVKVEVQVPDVPRPCVLELCLDHAEETVPTEHLGGRFRTLAQKRFWAVYSTDTRERIVFPPARPRKYGLLPPSPLVPAPAEALPSSREGWLVVYVQAFPGEYLSDVLDFVAQVASSVAEGRGFCVGEEPGVVHLPSGEQLYGVGFKRTSGFLEQALLSQTHPTRIIGVIESGRFVMPQNRASSATGVAYYTYHVPSGGPWPGPGR